MSTFRWPCDVSPEPELVAAWCALGQPSPVCLPWWVAEWLARGHDGPTMRELAGLGTRDVREAGELLPAALAEADIPVPGDRAVAAGVWCDHIARVYVEGLVGERWVAGMVDIVVRAAETDDRVLEFPLGTLYTIDDAWENPWGPGEAELRTLIRDACREQLVRAPT